MFAKAAALILTIGAVAATLLAARQQRLYAVHESAQAMRRIAEHDRTLWRLRGEIAERVTPGKVKKLADRFGPFAYFFEDRSSILNPPDDEGVRTVSDGKPDEPPPEDAETNAESHDGGAEDGAENEQ